MSQQESHEEDRAVVTTPRVFEAMSEPADEPKLTFRSFNVAFHLTAGRIAEATDHSSEPEARGQEWAMRSYEDDMLLYAHRDKPPFSTRVVGTDEMVTVGFAPQVTYEAEGVTRHLRSVAAGDTAYTKSFRLALAETVFEGSELGALGGPRVVGVLTLVLTPRDPPSKDSELDEYDVIKLVKLWEGGEGVADVASSTTGKLGQGVPTAITEGTDVWFALAPDERLTLHELATRLFPGWEPLASTPHIDDAPSVTTARNGFRVGTVELELPPTKDDEELFIDIAQLKRRREAPSDTERRDRVVAVGGILQGLLDFRRIDDSELADVFADVDVDVEDNEMRAFHKGTLLALSFEAVPPNEPVRSEAVPRHEGARRPPPIAVDPYLALPNIVLLHDEQRLKMARLRERDLSDRQRGSLVRDWANRAPIVETENQLGDIVRLLSQRLPDVFHYASERRLQQRGRKSRGLDDLEAFVRLRVDDLSGVLQWRVRRRDRWTAVLGIAVGVVTAFLVQQAIEGRPLWIIFIAAIVLFAAFLWLREKLF